MMGNSVDIAALLQRLREIVGHRHVLTSDRQTRRYRRGYRFGEGPALAVVRPGTLLEKWRVLEAAVQADVIVIVQAANTGLTGGSTPCGSDYDRPVLIINTLRIARCHLLAEGQQVVVLSGFTLDALEKRLRPLQREPHSLIGSSCLGASVVGGVCNNSGGALVRRGPAFTQLSLFARVDPEAGLTLVNHLGIRLGDTPEEILSRLDAGQFEPADVEYPAHLHASDPDYNEHVRDVEAKTPARFNADPRRLYEASGSAGKVVVFAVRLDTFPRETATRTFYIGVDDPAQLASLRRTILKDFANLPIAAEYMHRHMFDLARDYGKDMFVLIRCLGTDRLPRLFAFRAWLENWIERLPGTSPGGLDRLLQRLSCLLPNHLPRRLLAFRDRFHHHLIIKVSAEDGDSMSAHLARSFAGGEADWFECTADEAERAFLHRFVAAGAAVRYRAVHSQSIEGIVAIDAALPRNETDWFASLPQGSPGAIIKPLFYGHFLCHVFHLDYLVRRGCALDPVEHELLAYLSSRGAEYPAEHNVGHSYVAKPALAEHYAGLDPCNIFNPGIGKAPKIKAQAVAPLMLGADE